MKHLMLFLLLLPAFLSQAQSKESLERYIDSFLSLHKMKPNIQVKGNYHYKLLEETKGLYGPISIYVFSWNDIHLSTTYILVCDSVTEWKIYGYRQLSDDLIGLRLLFLNINITPDTKLKCYEYLIGNYYNPEKDY